MSFALIHVCLLYFYQQVEKTRTSPSALSYRFNWVVFYQVVTVTAICQQVRWF